MDESLLYNWEDGSSAYLDPCESQVGVEHICTSVPETGWFARLAESESARFSETQLLQTKSGGEQPKKTPDFSPWPPRAHVHPHIHVCPTLGNIGPHTP